MPLLWQGYAEGLGLRPFSHTAFPSFFQVVPKMDFHNHIRAANRIFPTHLKGSFVLF